MIHYNTNHEPTITTTPRPLAAADLGPSGGPSLGRGLGKGGGDR
jgi:hypothetical protein